MIFVHRQHSLRPFSRHYSHSLNPFLDLLTIPADSSSSVIQVSPTHTAHLLPILKAYIKAQKEETLLQVDFTTVNDYLWLLRAVTGEMAPVGRRGMFYLAAAVSDFFLPCHRVVSRTKTGFISGMNKLTVNGHCLSPNIRFKVRRVILL